MDTCHPHRDTFRVMSLRRLLATGFTAVALLLPALSSPNDAPPPIQLDASTSAVFDADGGIWIATGQQVFRLVSTLDPEGGAQHFAGSFATGQPEGIHDMFLDRRTGLLVTIAADHRSVHAFDPQAMQEAWSVDLPDDTPSLVMARAQAADVGKIALLVRNDTSEPDVQPGRRVFVLDSFNGQVVEVLDVDPIDSEDRRFAVSPDMERLVVGESRHARRLLEPGHADPALRNVRQHITDVGPYEWGPFSFRDGELALLNSSLFMSCIDITPWEPGSPFPPPIRIYQIFWHVRRSITVGGDEVRLIEIGPEGEVVGQACNPTPHLPAFEEVLGGLAHGGFSPSGDWVASESLMSLEDSRLFEPRTEGGAIQGDGRQSFAFDNEETRFLYWEEDRWVLVDLEAMEVLAEVATLGSALTESGMEDVIARLLHGPDGTLFEFVDFNSDRMVDAADIVAAQ